MLQRYTNLHFVVPSLVDDIQTCVSLTNRTYSLNIFWNVSNFYKKGFVIILLQCSIAVKYGPNIPKVTNYIVNVSGQPFFIYYCPLKSSPFSIQVLNNTQYYISIASKNAVGSSLNTYTMISTFLFTYVCLLLYRFIIRKFSVNNIRK